MGKNRRQNPGHISANARQQISLTTFVVALILAGTTAVIRAYRLPQTFLFAEDQEDLSWRVKQITIDRQPTLISAKFSSTGLYLSPGYLYFLIPFFRLTNFHPSASLIAVVTLAGTSAALVYLAGTTLAGPKTGLTAWAIYTFWPTLHTWDRIFWNPNLILPAASLALLALINISQGKKSWLPLAALAGGISLQSHPQGILLTILVLITLAILRQRINPTLTDWLKLGLILFFSVSPLVLFELRHGWVITQALPQTSVTFRAYYLLFLYPLFIIAISWSLNKLLWSRPGGIFLLSATLALIIVKNTPAMFSSPDRPDSLQHKLSLTAAALELMSKQGITRVHFHTSSEGFKYLFWYTARSQNWLRPIEFFESWQDAPSPKVVIKSPPLPSQAGTTFGNLQLYVIQP